jgi:hypothetical protein
MRPSTATVFPYAWFVPAVSGNHLWLVGLTGGGSFPFDEGEHAATARRTSVSARSEVVLIDALWP